MNNTRLVKNFNPYLLATLSIGITALFCSPLSNTDSYHLVSFILLLVVSVLATILNLGPVLLASTLSALVWNFFFIPPHLTFHIDKTDDMLVFGMFFIIALVNGVLTTRVRRQEKLIREREERTNSLFQLTRQLSKATGMEEVLSIARAEIKSKFGVEAFFILQDGNNNLASLKSLKETIELKLDEYALAEWTFSNQQKSGAFTSISPQLQYTYFPLPGNRINPGVMAIQSNCAIPIHHQTFWDTFIAQISNALEREFLGEMAQKARLLNESDRLYKTLFNSISHEFRIPVATIMGAADTLLSSANPAPIQRALSDEIFTASLRLNRLIENLLNISRLESGHISVRRDWYEINDLINKVTRDLAEELKPFTLTVSMQEEMPLVKIDYGLMEQVLYNLLYNASQHAPATSEIELGAKYSKGALIIWVKDQGAGFPEESLPKVFNKFFRVDGNKSGGLGLGLSIVKGFVEAHNGTITAENQMAGGARFTISIPSENPQINLQTETP